MENKPEDGTKSDAAAGDAADCVLPESGSDNSEQCAKKESESITNKVEENKQISVCEPIPSDGKDSKYESIVSAEAVEMDTTEFVSFPASREGLFSLNPSKVPSTGKENSIESDHVNNYEVEDDDLQVLEAFIKSANPEIAVCQAKHGEKITTKYSLESSLLDDLMKSDEVESLLGAINEEIAEPKITINSSHSTNSKLLFSEGLERLSSEITPALDNCPLVCKASNVSTQPMEPKSINVSQSFSPMKITDFDDNGEDILPNFTMRSLSNDLSPETAKRHRGRPSDCGKRCTKLEKKLRVEKLQRMKRCSEQRNLEKDAVEGVENSFAKDNGLEPLAPIDNTKESASSQRLRLNTRKRRNLAKCSDELNENQNKFAMAWNVNAEKEQVSFVSTSDKGSEDDESCKKLFFPRIEDPVCRSSLTYNELKSKAKEIVLPSPLWSVQIDDARDSITFLAAAADISESNLILEKAIIFEKTLKPVILLKNELINVPYYSLDNFEDVVLLIENLNNIQICEGTAITQRPYSKYCYKFVDVANSGQRCSQCIEERRRVLFCYTRKLREKVNLLEKP